MADEEITTRDALSAAFDKHAAEAPVDVAAPDPAPEAPQESAPVEAEAPATTSDEASPPASTASTQKPAVQAEVPATSTPPAAAAKPPRSWSPEAKTAFASLPEAVKQDVLRREKEISQGLERAAPAREHFERFSEVVKPFEPLLAAYNADPIDAVKTLMSTRAALEIGTPEQKAQIVAGIIHDFGLDVTLLDDLLVQRGAVQPFRPASPPRPAPVDPRIEELLNTLQATKVAKAEAEVAKVEALPHFDDLREDMADIVERFAAVGKPITVEQAYKRALAMNPDLEPASAAAPTISKSQAAAILASRNAASSVSGAPRTGATPAPTDRRSQIAAAFEAARR